MLNVTSNTANAFIDSGEFCIPVGTRFSAGKSREALIKSARAGSERFCSQARFEKRRNTVCISRFSNRRLGAKDPLSSRRRFIQSFPSVLYLCFRLTRERDRIRPPSPKLILLYSILKHDGFQKVCVLLVQGSKTQDVGVTPARSCCEPHLFEIWTDVANKHVLRLKICHSL